MKTRTAFTGIALGLTVGLLASCVTSQRAGSSSQAPVKVWPPAPNEPRIAFVESLRGPGDIGEKPGMLKTFANWITGDTPKSSDLQKPFAVALDEKGSLCIADTDAKQVCIADFTRKQWKRYSKAGKTGFVCPVAVARFNSITYVADSELGKVLAFKEDGTSAFEIGKPMTRPVGLAVANEQLFVVDSMANAVFVFGLDGAFKYQFGERGTDPGEFNFPTCVTVDKHGHLLVSDTMNCRVQTFDLRGKFISQFGSNGDTSGHFSRPKGVAVDPAGHVYVVDALFDNFQIFDGEGRLLLNVGESGADAGEFGLPNGIAIGNDNRIFVADAFNHRVQVFKYLNQP